MKWLGRVGLVLALAYLGVCLVLGLLENSMVFRPAKAQASWQPAPSADIKDVDLQTVQRTRIHGWWLPCPGAEEAVLYCHGNAGNLSHRGGSIAKLRELLKVSVLIFDYPGYGKSEGRPSEQGCYEAADAAFVFLTDTQKIDPKKIILFGGSLGGGVALELATRHPQRAIVLAKTFTSAPDAGATMFPWLPVRWLMRNRFDNLSRIKTCKTPIFIAHGTLDTLIPIAHSQRLFAAAVEPKQFFVLEGADHNDPLPDEMFLALRTFLEKHR